MITRVARNDVVRVLRTGEVGLIKGWADHEQLAKHGTVLDISMGGGRTVQANGNALEFVARAKIEWSRPLRAWQLFLLVTTMAYGSWVGYGLVDDYDVSITTGVFVGYMAQFFSYFTMKAWTMYPKRTRVTLPKRVAAESGRGPDQRVNK